jgi:ADP-heptose:LPS heptosyltransferase
MRRLDENTTVDRGETPGGSNALRELLYPFHKTWPRKAWSKLRWRLNEDLGQKLPQLNEREAKITVIDRLGAPGDALLSAIVTHNLKRVYPQLRVNCITPHPELLKLDPLIDSINGKETFYSFDSTYWELVCQKDASTNVVAHSLAKVGIDSCEYKARFYLSKEESAWGKQQTVGLRRPLFSVNAASKEPVKTWPKGNWQALLPLLQEIGDVVQLGDDREPELVGVKRFAGKLTMRESAAVLAQADLHIGPDSLLMHMANGVDVPAVILMGGSRPEECLGYADNINLTSTPDCSPCWIHQGYETCMHEVECMSALTVEAVLEAVDSLSDISSPLYSSTQKAPMLGAATTIQ